MVKLWLTAYAEGGVNDRVNDGALAHPDVARRVLIATTREEPALSGALLWQRFVIPDLKLFVEYYLGGMSVSSYCRALRKHMKGPSKKAPRRRRAAVRIAVLIG